MVANVQKLDFALIALFMSNAYGLWNIQKFQNTKVVPQISYQR